MSIVLLPKLFLPVHPFSVCEAVTLPLPFSFSFLLCSETCSCSSWAAHCPLPDSLCSLEKSMHCICSIIIIPIFFKLALICPLLLLMDIFDSNISINMHSTISQYFLQWSFYSIQRLEMSATIPLFYKLVKSEHILVNRQLLWQYEFLYINRTLSKQYDSFQHFVKETGASKDSS